MAHACTHTRIGHPRLPFVAKAAPISRGPESDTLETCHAHWGLNPGPSACRADVMPLHHMPAQRHGHASGTVGHSTSGGPIASRRCSSLRAGRRSGSGWPGWRRWRTCSTSERRRRVIMKTKTFNQVYGTRAAHAKHRVSPQRSSRVHPCGRSNSAISDA